MPADAKKPSVTPPPMADSAIVYRLDCAHCQTSGTCKSGLNGSSCAVCVTSAFQQQRSRRDKLLGRAVALNLAGITQQERMGLVCSVCHGIGTDEPKTLKFHNRFLPCFAAGFVLSLLLSLMFLAFKDAKEVFHPFLTFAATAVGSVTGYYFGGAKQQIASLAQRRAATTSELADERKVPPATDVQPPAGDAKNPEEPG